MAEIVRTPLPGHDVVHVHELDGWAGTKDNEPYARAGTAGFHAIITHGTGQLSRLTAVDPSRRSRSQVKDPALEPPKYWPGR